MNAAATYYIRKLSYVRDVTLTYAYDIGLSNHDRCALVWAKPAHVLMSRPELMTMQAIERCKRYCDDLKAKRAES